MTVLVTALNDLQIMFAGAVLLLVAYLVISRSSLCVVIPAWAGRCEVSLSLTLLVPWERFLSLKITGFDVCNRLATSRKDTPFWSHESTLALSKLLSFCLNGRSF